MKEVLTNILVFIVAVVTTIGLLKLYMLKKQRELADKEKYKGYVSRNKRPRLLKNDLIANWVYDMREEKDKKGWLENKDLHISGKDY